MGLIHTRASKNRDKAQAALLKEELRERKAESAASKPALQQPTVGLMLRKLVSSREAGTR